MSLRLLEAIASIENLASLVEYSGCIDLDSVIDGIRYVSLALREIKSLLEESGTKVLITVLREVAKRPHVKWVLSTSGIVLGFTIVPNRINVRSVIEPLHEKSIITAVLRDTPRKMPRVSGASLSIERRGGIYVARIETQLTRSLSPTTAILRNILENPICIE